MILSLALALAAANRHRLPRPSSCPTVLTHEAQACRAVEASKAGRFADAAAAFESGGRPGLRQ